MRGQVVVIDDEMAMLDVLQQVLETEGLSVLRGNDPEVILRDSPNLRPDAFLIDVALLRSGGIEVAKQLRTTRFPSTPMIAMTASIAMAQHAAHSDLFDGVLEKPFDALQLLTVIEQRLASAT